MSTSPMPTPFLVPRSRQQTRVIAMPRPAVDTSAIIRRRPSCEQGQALEILGHALEYLVDSRMYLSKERKTKADGEAIHILSGCSRQVFATCAEIVPVRHRFKNWVTERLGLGSMESLGHISGSKL